MRENRESDHRGATRASLGQPCRSKSPAERNIRGERGPARVADNGGVGEIGLGSGLESGKRRNWKQEEGTIKGFQRDKKMRVLGCRFINEEILGFTIGMQRNQHTTIKRMGQELRVLQQGVVCRLILLTLSGWFMIQNNKVMLIQLLVTRYHSISPILRNVCLFFF